MDRIYLDHNATTPPLPEVVSTMTRALAETYGNPASLHWHGLQARRVLDRAREQVAALVGATAGEVVLCSGGTEANNLALKGAVAHRPGAHVVTCAVEHQAVLNPCRALEAQGVAVTYVGVDSEGRVDPDEVADVLTDRTVLLSIQLANNDVGTLQPVAALARLARARGVLCHSDAVQAAGRIPLDVEELGVDLLSLSGHKLHGPKGVGALVVRRGVELAPILHGGHQERGLRSGTENLPGIAGFGAACEAARRTMATVGPALRGLRDHLQRQLLEALPGVVVNGPREGRLPNTLNVTLPGVDAEAVVLHLDLLGVSASTGSACSSGSEEPSYVLRAMGRDEAAARSSLRLSLGRDNTVEEVDRASLALVRAVELVRDVADPGAPPTARELPA